MNLEEFALFTIPVIAFLTSLFLTFGFGKNRNYVGLISLGAVWAAFTGVMFLAVEAATGWDGLGYAAALVGISAPAGIAGLIGGIVGWAKSEKAAHV